MRNMTRQFLLATAFSIASTACATGPLPASAVNTPAAAPALSMPAPVMATPTFEQPTLPPTLVTIQQGNTFPKFRLLVKESKDLQDNRMGAFAGGLTGGGWKPGQPWDYQWMVDQIVSRGLKRFRVAIDNLDASNVDWAVPQYTTDPSHDALITLLAQNGVTMTYVLTFWDKETWPGGQGANCPRFRDEAEIERYLQFVKYMVHHFKDRIQNFEIWNEPDIAVCPQQILVDDYINLVRQAASVIRQEVPGARIVVGSPSYLREPDAQRYLFTILRSDIMPLVDVVAWHPMYGTSPEFDPAYLAQYPSIVQEIKDTASAHGFTGTYEADELTWFTTGGKQWDGWSKRYSDTAAAKYMARGIVMHLGEDVTAGLASALLFDPKWVAIPFTVRNLSTIMAGAKTAALPVEIESDAKNVVSYAFSLDNGDRLLAFWADRAASDDDAGVSATLTLPGLTARQVSGVDVLNGFEQQMVASDEDGNLVVRNLQVKDYPLIIRFTDLRSP
jgi:hypothetical protein